MANRLAQESSPYLLQHAHNPVDWYPWGPEALERAGAEDKPILLSIGYSACHWCHVMERESFEDEETARVMNENFVNIKVDREERPDLDGIYMQAVQAMTGSGGWPMTVFLTPEGDPFYGGTYFPPEDRHGMPGFPRVLGAVAEAYRERKANVQEAGQKLSLQLREVSQAPAAQDPLTQDILHEAQRALVVRFDWTNGGFGQAPKFPQPMTLEFLLRYYKRTGHAQTLEMVELTLEKMAGGGIYDQLGGGFHRYSTDERWLTPHFEKMLYDNALLVRLYLHAYQATGKPLYRRIVEETLDYLLREMTTSEGGFYSSQDADSQGVEGKSFVWSREEVDTALGEGAEAFARYFDISSTGNWEGHNILNVKEGEPLEPEGQLAELLKRGKEKLLRLRGERIPPGRDDKILAAWNGLALAGLAEAACVLDREDYRQAAEKAAAFLLAKLRPQGRLLRTYREGQAKLLGCLEDYSFLIDALLVMHEATFEVRWLQEARDLANEMLRLFWEPAESAFYDTGTDHEQLILRPRDVMDNATPCGASVAVDVLLRLAILCDDASYNEAAAAALRQVQLLMSKQPSAGGHWLCALDFYLSSPIELAIIGPREESATRELLAAVYGRFLPNKVLTGADGSADGEWPLLQGKAMLERRPTAYVCERYACKEPVATPEALTQQLEAAG